MVSNGLSAGVEGRDVMNVAIETALVNYGVLGIIAVVFFKQYFDDKKETKEFKSKQMEHEKEMAVILNDATRATTDYKEVIKDTRVIHDELDIVINQINSGIEVINTKIDEAHRQDKELRESVVGLKGSVEKLLSSLGG